MTPLLGTQALNNPPARTLTRAGVFRASPFDQLSSQPFLKPALWAGSTPMADPAALLGQDVKEAACPGMATVHPRAWRPGSPLPPPEPFLSTASSPPGAAVPLDSCCGEEQRGPLSAPPPPAYPRLPLREGACQSGLVRSQDLTFRLSQAQSFREPHF